jgi:hypothetical protein
MCFFTYCTIYLGGVIVSVLAIGPKVSQIQTRLRQLIFKSLPVIYVVCIEKLLVSSSAEAMICIMKLQLQTADINIFHA